jgi:hypothetical protein
MDAAIVSAMAAVFGSTVGGSATVATAWVTQRSSLISKGELISAEIRKRETLYGEFISACSRLVIDSIEHTLDKPEKLLPAYELLNRIRLSLVVRISSYSPFTLPRAGSSGSSGSMRPTKERGCTT